MSELTREIFEQLGIALGLGLLVGLQRQHRASLIAGLRTFSLITVLGVLAAVFDQRASSGGWVVPCGLLGLVLVAAVSKAYELRREGADLGITTEVAILLMYLVGASLVVSDRTAAVAVGIGTAVLLQFKAEMHGVAARLGDKDLRAIMTFALISGIILPLLPNRTYDLFSPLEVLNPFEIWLMVVLMVGITLGGYLAYKFLGRDVGVLLGGLLGGAISSTATTLGYARRSRASPATVPLAAAIIGIASAVVYLRVIVEILAAAPQRWTEMVPPIAICGLASAASAAFAWWHTRRAPEEMPEQGNPAELKTSLLFAGLFAGVLLALTAAQRFLGAQGLYAVAVLSGLTDMDAITLSTSRLTGLEPERGGVDVSQAWRVIVLASMANLCFKGAFCAALGSRGLFWRIGAVFAVPLVTGGLLLWLWP